MYDDPKKIGVPIFLQTQNRTPPTAKTAVGFPYAPDPKPRVDWHKPKGLDWEAWDAHRAQEEAGRVKKG